MPLCPLAGGAAAFGVSGVLPAAGFACAPWGRATDGLKRRPGWEVASSAGRAGFWAEVVPVVRVLDGLRRWPDWGASGAGRAGFWAEVVPVVRYPHGESCRDTRHLLSGIGGGSRPSRFRSAAGARGLAPPSVAGQGRPRGPEGPGGELARP
ncbi:hypothetical protein Srut_19190 [Streptomyces rutgersensis]|nr:hypothetical protein Srut_19190 [Streptomyces rutgersensis]